MEHATPDEGATGGDKLAADAVVRATFDSAPDGLIVLGRDGEVLVFNPRFQALWQLPPELLARRDPEEFHRHIAAQLADPEAYHRSIAAIRAASQSRTFDTVQLCDGRVLERHVSPMGAVAGVPSAQGGVVVRWREVTQQHRAEQALATTQARLSALFEHALNAILLFDDQQRYVDVNPAACELLGYRREELLGMSARQLLLPGSIDLAARWQHLMQTGRQRGRVQLLCKDGRVVAAQFSTVARVLPGVHLSVLSDATEEDRALQRQREIATLLDLALVAADLAYCDIDLQTGQVNAVNERWYSIVGYQAGELDGDFQAWDALVHPEDAAARLEAWEAHMHGDRPRYEAEFRMRHKDGHWVWLQARGQAVARGPDGRATRLVGTRQDISNHKRAEQWLQALAHTDELTGIHNRRRFLELAGIELARARRHGHPVALLMIDLDHFKAINDAHGHGGGDQVLRSFVRTARTVMRQSDVFARVGGEEFAALLPYADVPGACAIAERLLQQTRATPAQLDGGAAVRYSVSVGVTVMAAGQPVDSAHGELHDPPERLAADGAEPPTVQALMTAADQALYQAKSRGRDRMVLDEH